MVNYNALLQSNDNDNNRLSNILRQLNKRSQNSNSDENLIKNLELSKNLFKEDAYDTNSRLKNKAIRVTKPSLVMFNVAVDNDKTLNLLELAKKIEQPFDKHVFPNNGISIQVVKVTGYVGRFQPAFTITNAYASKNHTANLSRVFALDFYIKVQLGPEIVNATFTLFKNGKIKISGGYLSQNKENVDNDYYFEAQPEMIREYIVNTYTDGQAFLRKSFVFNNVVGEFRVNKKFNLATIKGLGKNVQYEPELSHLLKIKSGGFNFTFSQNGVVQVRGLKEQDSLDKAYAVGLKLINDMTDFHATHKGGRLYANRVLPEFRRKTQHVMNPNEPAPNVTRRGTSCPVGRRPSPYSMQGTCPKAGCYVKPNPQGQPCCYKVPKNTKYSEGKVRDAYEKANVRVPSKVREVFNFGNNTDAKRNNTTHAAANNIVVRRNETSGLKIGTRQCSRYTKVALVDIARRLGLAVKPAMTKPQLCELIASRAKNATNTNTKTGNRAVTFKNGAKTYVVTGNSPASLRIGNRFAKTYKRDQLARFALRMRVQVPDGATVLEMCHRIAAAASARRPATPVSPSASSSPNNNEALRIVQERLRLTNNLIKEDIRAMYKSDVVPDINARAKRVHTVIEKSFDRDIGYGKVEMSKTGMPKLGSIQKIKKRLVRSFRHANKKPGAPKAPVAAPRALPKRVAPTQRSRENIYKQLNAMYAKGEYANIANFNYANQNIVEQYYANKARASPVNEYTRVRAELDKPQRVNLARRNKNTEEI